MSPAFRASGTNVLSPKTTCQKVSCWCQPGMKEQRQVLAIQETNQASRIVRERYYEGMIHKKRNKLMA